METYRNNLILLYSIIRVTILVTILASPTSAQIVTSNDTTVGYGFDCNEVSSPCDKNKSLSCFSGFCQCILPETMTYDLEAESCVVLAQEPCIVEDPVSLSIDHNVTNLQVPTQRELPCGKNSLCNKPARICLCDDLFMSSDNGSCIPKKLLNESCTASQDCREDLGLVCIENLCVCDSDISIYNILENPNGCVGQTEKPCIQDMCTANARCVNDTLIDDEEMEAGEDSNNDASSNSITEKQSSTKICKCYDGYDPTPSGSCAKDYGIVCDGVRSCKPWLRCGVGGTCECSNPMNQFYDENAATCISKVHGVCNANYTLDFEQENDICIVGAECVVNMTVSNDDNKQQNDSASMSASTTYHCLCKKGFLENDDGSCDLGFGSICKTDDGNTLDLECSAKANLECIDGKCQCNSSLYEYDVNEKQCVGLSGAMCTGAVFLTRSINHDAGGDETVVPQENQEEKIMDSIQNGQKKRIKCIKGAKCDILSELASEEMTMMTYSEKDGSMEGVCRCVGESIGRSKRCDEPPPNAEYIIATAAVIFVIAVIGCCCYAFLKRQGYLVEALI